MVIFRTTNVKSSLAFPEKSVVYWGKKNWVILKNKCEILRNEDNTGRKVGSHKKGRFCIKKRDGPEKKIPE